MPRGSRRLLLLILLAVCAGFAWWGFATNPSITTPSTAEGTPTSSRSPASAEPETAQRRADPARADAADAAGTSDRRIVPGIAAAEASAKGPRTLARVALYPSFPMQPFTGPTALELALERGDERVPLTWGFDADRKTTANASAQVSPGAWRIVVVHGPGDRPGLTRSQLWSLEPPEEITVRAGDTLRRMAVLSRAVDAPAPGRCTIRGYATIDGRPAANRPVMLAPFGMGGATTRTNGDGWFELDDAPAGHAELQLLAIPRKNGRSFAPIHALARLPVAGLDGEVLEVTLRGATGAVRLQLLEANGAPAFDTQVSLWSRGVLTTVLPNQPQVDEPFRSFTGVDGRVAFEGLPAADYRLTVGPLGDAPLSERRLAIAPGSNQDLGALHLAPRAKATVELVVAGDPERSLRRAAVELVSLDGAEGGPVEARVGRANLVRFGHLEPGRYSVHVRSRRSELVSAEPITVLVGENPSIRAVVRPSSDVSAGRRPADPAQIQSQDRR